MGAGKSGLTSAIDLNKFVNNSKTLYNFIIKEKNKVNSPIFCNNKNDVNKAIILGVNENDFTTVEYDKGKRDMLFNGEGSFYAMSITFSNDDKSLIEAILLISTYGKHFLPVDADFGVQLEFYKAMAEDVIPYYVSLIQAELGALYMRHNIENIGLLAVKKKLKKPKCFPKK